MYKGEQHMFAEWKAKLVAYLPSKAQRNVDQWIEWAGEQGKPIIGDGAAFGTDPEFKGVSLALSARLVASTTGHPYETGWSR